MSRCTVTSLIAGVCLGVVLGAAAPAHGATFIYLNSDPDDYVGLGLQYLDRSTDGIFTVNPYGTNAVEVYFDSDDIAGDFWIAVLSGPSGEPLTPGTYEGARRFGDAGTPGLDVGGNGRGCNQTTGRFVVHEIAYDLRGDVAAFAADFEQHCEGADPALRGAIRFRSGDAACTAGDGTPCDDGDPCTPDDACYGGECAGTDTISQTCTPTDACHTAGLCDRLTATCTHGGSRPDGTACDDGDACTATSACHAGRCVGGETVDCNDHSACTIDRCDPVTGCVHDRVAGTCWVAHPEELLVDSAAANGRSARCVRRCQSGGTSTLLLGDDGMYRFLGGVARDCPSGHEVRFPDELGTTRPARQGRLVLNPSNLADIRAATRACNPAIRGPRSYHASLTRRRGGSLLLATTSEQFRFPGAIPVTRQATIRSTYVPGLDASGQPVLPPFPSVDLPLCSATLRFRCEVH